MFYYISPALTSYTNIGTVKKLIINCAISKGGKSGFATFLDEQNFLTISAQFQAYGLVHVENLQTTQGEFADFWILTNKGKTLMLQMRTIKE
ncbi:hypothetical protein CYR23_21600 [Chimaeribacter arupi]|nr:hypothetical protein CYR23_21600 [Chimaeribacter arupi]